MEVGQKLARRRCVALPQGHARTRAASLML